MLWGLACLSGPDLSNSLTFPIIPRYRSVKLSVTTHEPAPLAAVLPGTCSLLWRADGSAIVQHNELAFLTHISTFCTVHAHYLCCLYVIECEKISPFRMRIFLICASTVPCSIYIYMYSSKCSRVYVTHQCALDEGKVV